ncbi:MAG: ATP-binding protein [Candidatus Pacearchaeota archaeon]|jgi:predicted AAA+ superfamily ATPase
MISKEKLRRIVLNQKNRMLAKKETTERTIEKEVLSFFKDNRILILTGIRRSGKSTILSHLIKSCKGFTYLNFEDEGLLDFEAKDFEDLNEVLTDVYGENKFYFFDEIQEVKNFESFVRRLQDDGKKIIITGSNASLLSKEFATKLTGRNKSFEVHPFSFKEFLLYNNFVYSKEDFFITKKKAMIKKMFSDYMGKGGMPEYLNLGDVDYLKNVYDNIIYRDIVARYDIRKEVVLKELVVLLTSNMSNTFTYNSLRKSLKLSNAITIKEYIGYLKNSYLFFEVLRFSYSLKEQLNSPKKVYLIDHSFQKVFGTMFSPNKGWILENIVFVELLRRKNNVSYYSGKGECDFIAKKLNKVTDAIQVCFELTNKNRDREINGLAEAMEKFKLKTGLVLTMDDDEEIIINKKKIIVKPVWRWLLE